MKLAHLTVRRIGTATFAAIIRYSPTIGREAIFHRPAKPPYAGRAQLVVSERSEAVGEEKRDFNGLPTGGQAYTLSDGKRSVETLSKQRGGWLS